MFRLCYNAIIINISGIYILTPVFGKVVGVVVVVWFPCISIAADFEPFDSNSFAFASEITILVADTVAFPSFDALKNAYKIEEEVINENILRSLIIKKEA